ncbi:unnamed protein product, partial [Trifolium pratense]
MESLVARNLFEGYRIGETNTISVSHLQFADDTLLLGGKSWGNVRALRAALVLFETMSGLKVNFNKSMLVGVNIPDSWLGEAASALCCKVGKIPFIYLGLPIGGDSRRLSFWEQVLDRLKTRLSGWKSRFLSVGGRLVLLKSGGRLRDGGRRGSSWWREIARIREGVETKSFTMAEMFTLGWGLDGAAWVWRRQLRAWEEEMLGECQTLLSNISLQTHITDRWQWQPDHDTGYSVRGAYELLTTLDSVTIDDAEHLIWHSQVPLKVSIFAWRLLRDRLPTKSNLISRGILSSATHLCISGCGEA